MFRFPMCVYIYMTWFDKRKAWCWYYILFFLKWCWYYIPSEFRVILVVIYYLMLLFFIRISFHAVYTLYMA